MSGLDWRAGSSGASVRLGSRHLGKREWLLIGVLVLVPIPLLALSGIGLPLPGVVERGLASLLPGGSSSHPPANLGSVTGAANGRSSGDPVAARTPRQAVHVDGPGSRVASVPGRGSTAGGGSAPGGGGAPGGGSGPQGGSGSGSDPRVVPLPDPEAAVLVLRSADNPGVSVATKAGASAGASAPGGTSAGISVGGSSADAAVTGPGGTSAGASADGSSSDAGASAAVTGPDGASAGASADGSGSDAGASADVSVPGDSSPSAGVTVPTDGSAPSVNVGGLP